MGGRGCGVHSKWAFGETTHKCTRKSTRSQSITTHQHINVNRVVTRATPSHWHVARWRLAHHARYQKHVDHPADAGDAQGEQPDYTCDWSLELEPVHPQEAKKRPQHVGQCNGPTQGWPAVDNEDLRPLADWLHGGGGEKAEEVHRTTCGPLRGAAHAPASYAAVARARTVVSTRGSKQASLAPQRARKMTRATD